MRVVIAAVLVAGALSGCNGRGGRHVVLLPDEVKQRNDAEWRVTGEPAGGARSTPPADQATER
jgi:hypothetical protein